LTLHERLAAAREQLVRAGIDPREAAVDVDVYARTILKWDRAGILLHHPEPVPDQLEPTFSAWLARRERFEPTPYIVGEREFWGLDLYITPSVLIPRPETELVVQEAVTRAQGQPVRFADIGTGSGCIAVAIAHEVRHVEGVATDVSAAALNVAKANAQRHHVATRLKFVCTSYLDGVAGSFDLIAANPPYVREIDRRGLGPGVLQEPHVALFGGENGLRHIEAVVATSSTRLKRGGWLIMEFGFGQEDDVRAVAARHAELVVRDVRADLQGLARTVMIQRK
jgi:release factor glutamine methyltransferase